MEPKFHSYMVFLFDQVVQDDKWSSLNEHLSTNGDRKYTQVELVFVNAPIQKSGCHRQRGALWPC